MKQKYEQANVSILSGRGFSNVQVCSSETRCVVQERLQYTSIEKDSLKKQCVTYTYLFPMGMAKTCIVSMPARLVQFAYAYENNGLFLNVVAVRIKYRSKFSRIQQC